MSVEHYGLRWTSEDCSSNSAFRVTALVPFSMASSRTRRKVLKFLPVVYLVSNVAPGVNALGTICPNSCNGHGTCDSTRECTCFNGFTGADCSERECLTGAAWFAAPSDTDIAHTTAVECSNAGNCNRATGVCDCDSRFEGAACDRLRCPTGGTSSPCSGHGRCLTMAQIAEDRNDFSTFVETTYTGTFHYLTFASPLVAVHIPVYTPASKSNASAFYPSRHLGR